MAVFTGTVPAAPIGTSIVEDTSSNNTPEDADSSGGTLHQVYIDNTGNSGQVYVKLYELVKGSVTVGTTPPSFIFSCPASSTRQFNFPTGITYASKLSFACVTAAGTGGTSAPTNPVTVLLALT
jgi:hypothetical protein